MTICGPHPGKKPNKIATKGTKGNHKSKNILRSKLVKYINISKTKKGRILLNKSQIIELIRKDLNNNDYLMIKASLATGFNDIVKDLKGLH